MLTKDDVVPGIQLRVMKNRLEMILDFDSRMEREPLMADAPVYEVFLDLVGYHELVPGDIFTVLSGVKRIDNLPSIFIRTSNNLTGTLALRDVLTSTEIVNNDRS